MLHRGNNDNQLRPAGGVHREAVQRAGGLFDTAALQPRIFAAAYSWILHQNVAMDSTHVFVSASSDAGDNLLVLTRKSSLVAGHWKNREGDTSFEDSSQSVSVYFCNPIITLIFSEIFLKCKVICVK